MAATHDDAMLMVELCKWGSMAGIDEAAREIQSDDFDPKVLTRWIRACRRC